MNDMPVNVAQLIIEWQLRALNCHEFPGGTPTEKHKSLAEAITYNLCADDLAALYEYRDDEAPQKAATPVSYPENGG